MLVHVDFNLTNACNLACTHCHSASGKALPNELTTSEIKGAVRQAYDMGALSIAFAGGEPFMRRDLLDILEYAAELPGWRVAVITNGLFFSTAVLDRLAERSPNVILNVSVDGSTPETFGMLRAQPGSSPAARRALFERVIGGVKQTIDRALPISVNTTMTKANRHDLLNTYALVVDELGADSMVAIKFFPAGYGRDHLEQYDFSWPEWSEFFGSLSKERMAGRIPRMQLSVPSPWEFYLPLIHAGINLADAEAAWRYRSPLREDSYSRARAIGDVAGWAELCIAGDGTVYPSVLMVGEPTQMCGELRHQSLQDIWTKSERLTGIRSLSLADIAGQCSNCAFSPLCGGGSRSRALAEHGDLTAADDACPLISGTAAHVQVAS